MLSLIHAYPVGFPTLVGIITILIACALMFVLPPIGKIESFYPSHNR